MMYKPRKKSINEMFYEHSEDILKTMILMVVITFVMIVVINVTDAIGLWLANKI